MAMLDLRRTDQRRQTLENPVWVSSAEINPACDDTEAVLFSFPLTGGFCPSRGLTVIDAICCEIITAFAGGTITLDIGLGTIPLESSVTGATVTETDVDEFIDNTEITHGTPAAYFPATGDFIAGLILSTYVSPNVLAHLDSAVPVIYAKLLSDAAITAGAARVHALMSSVPLMT